MAGSIFRHKGDWSPHTEENRALRFIHAYVGDVTGNLNLDSSDTKFYAPSAVFFDTTNVTYTSAGAIKKWMRQLFSKVDKLEADAKSFLVIDESTSYKTLYTVNAEFNFRYFVKGDPSPILVPRMFVFEIRDKESEDGFDDLQLYDVKLYWDTALLKDEIRRRDNIAG
jgi:hypothetical protein